ncbi:MAG: hypothetical protein FJX36_17415 [Alphaproteobacteria bacterium]|nr:hypothetical protein [Alphaproteobacteria bacterium]
MHTLYSMPMTRAGRIRWALKEIGAPYREIEHCHVNSLWSARRAGTIITVFGLARDALGR